MPGLFGFGGGGPSIEDPQTQQILDLLQSLEQAPPETPPVQPTEQPSTLQRVLLGGTPRHFVGSLGDAIAAMAAVRAGGAPPATGAYAAAQEREALRQAQQMEAYRQRQEENAAADRSLRNTIRVSTFQEGLKQAGAEKLANIKAKNTRGLKSEFVRDVNGTSHRFVRLLDPTTGETMPLVDPSTGEQVDELDLGPAGYAPSVIPGMMEGQAGIFRVPRAAGAPASAVTGPGGAKLEPPPVVGLAQEAGGKIGVLQGIPHLKEVFDATDAKLRGTGKLAQVKNWAFAQTAGTSLQPIAMPVPMQRYFTEMRAILAPYVRSVSGLVFPEAELRRYEARMPIPGVTDPSVVESQWDSLIQEMVRDIKAKYGATGRQAPAIPSGSAPTNPVDDILNQYKKEYGGGANPTP